MRHNVFVGALVREACPFPELRQALEKLQTRVTAAALDQQELPILQQITRRWRTQQRTETAGHSKLDAAVGAGVLGAKVGVQASITDFDKSLDDTEYIMSIQMLSYDLIHSRNFWQRFRLWWQKAASRGLLYSLTIFPS
jgi:hypothetical protein